ncbi:MAG: FG-GAP repeat domain-containing protein [Candidatus Midichloria sp.]|uniref:VCBS repeat containing protein n=1 Tax=Hyalomma marginatum TaxID=34627 RepID=A0A8S4BVH5_9ACAR|nr:VCBS repeat containing protein [Hyalomma marginatum]CAG7589428.1 VCBS repeat containing protein [Hyalomma marginatum]
MEEFSFCATIGKGDGTFQASTLHGIGGSSSWGVAVGNFNNDGKLDIVTTNYHAGTIFILTNVLPTQTRAIQPAVLCGG